MRRIAVPRKYKTKSSTIGSEIIESLKDLCETLQSGVPLESRYTVHTVRLKNGPKDYDAKAVKATRVRIGASQAIFAQLVGVSVKLVQSWEQGARRPQKIARRLLDEINANPARWKQMMQPHSTKIVRASVPTRKKKSA